jgi:hypothetical protein
MYRLQQHSKLSGNMPERSCEPLSVRCPAYVEQLVAAVVAYPQRALSWESEHRPALAEAAHPPHQDLAQSEEKQAA